jgi:hypothetical protein
MLRTQTGLDKTSCINRTLAVHDRMSSGETSNRRSTTLKHPLELYLS